ncbi:MULTISPECIES: nuclear transport factor 2 family protein [unclassified Acidovorax]|uniref:nuclear transport factor 2 family protein n=1 Tax=unclassified Acidovorax TaxID=2684926 RepID=UPI002883534B|nr:MULTISPECIES: nuclear transport factor 2 family protein [unclassified Acidovorax]
MQHAPFEGTPAPAQDAGSLVEEFLRLIMIPAPEQASRLVSPQLAIRFTGGRAMQRPADCAAFNAQRYAWVKKRFERTDVAQGATDAEAVVYNTGTLHGAWPDGTPFEGNRYIDRYVVCHGLIVQMDVWNDSAEWLLVRAGLAAPWPSPMQPPAEPGA